MIDKILYNYRVNFAGISKSSNKRPLDIVIVTQQLINDLKERNFNDNTFLRNLYQKMARELFHFICRGENGMFKIKSMDENLYKWLCTYLNFRRIMILKFSLLRRGIVLK